MLGSKLPAVLSTRPNNTMKCAQKPKISRLIAAGFAGCVALSAASQTTLPATQPTSATAPNAAAPTLPADNQQRHRARVTYQNGLLEVHADNSSLNQILREISRQTGMRIIGGVADQRVFGSYGPASASTVLQTLLEPTNTNMLLEESPTHDPKQLVLSARSGGGTPPPPSSSSYDAYESEPELPLPAGAQPAPARTVPVAMAPVGTPATSTSAPSSPPVMPQPADNVLGSPTNVSPTASTLPVTNSVPISTLPTPSTVPPVRGIVDAPNPPPAGSTTAGFTSQTPPDNNPNNAQPAANQSAPSGPKTPEQIYEELKQLQQRKANQQANPQGSSTPQ